MPNGKLGTASAVIYFVNRTDPRHWPGYVMLAPYSGCETPEGYERCVADDLPSCRALEARLNEDAQREWEAEYMREEAGLGRIKQAKRDQLYRRLFSSETSDHDKEYIREWLKLQDEKKREKYRAHFEHRNIVLHALHYDIAKGRDGDDEIVNVERIG